MKRIYHPYWKWEEVEMWYKKDFDIQKAIEFTGNAELYGSWMLRVLDSYPLACEHNLTADGNKKAWIGHAAAWLAIGSPEYVTRDAWGSLTKQQQTEANLKAESAIKEWIRRQRSKAISELGKNVVTWMAYPTAPRRNWKQQSLFRHIDEYAGQSCETICA